MDQGSSVLRKWLEYEMSSVHRGMVTRRKSLGSLLGMEDPHCLTREGQRHAFDRDILDGFAGATPLEKHSTLLLPVTLFFDLKVENQCYISDEVAADAVRSLEGFEEVYPYRDGKMWLPCSIGMGVEIQRGHPAIVPSLKKEAAYSSSSSSLRAQMSSGTSS